MGKRRIAGGCLFLSLLLLGFAPQLAYASQNYPYGGGGSLISNAREAFEPTLVSLVQVDTNKEVSEGALLENYLTLADVWSYAYQYRDDGEKLLKDTWLAFRDKAGFDLWKGAWPESASLLVAWNENTTWHYAAMYSVFQTDPDTGDTSSQWYFNAWKNVHYNIYVLRDWFLQKFIPMAARAPRGEADYESLVNIMISGDADGFYEIRVTWWGGDWKVPIAAILTIFGLGAIRRRNRQRVTKK